MINERLEVINGELIQATICSRRFLLANLTETVPAEYVAVEGPHWLSFRDLALSSKDASSVMAGETR